MYEAVQGVRAPSGVGVADFRTEITRRFLVNTTLADEVAIGRTIITAYCSFGTDESEVRLRRETGKPLLCTQKIVEGRRRKVIELEVTEPVFARMWEQAYPWPTTKTRRSVVLERGHIAQLDIYTAPRRLAGFTLMHVKFAQPGQADRFVPPEWFGEEVTHNHAYGDVPLARDGEPTMKGITK